MKKLQLLVLFIFGMIAFSFTAQAAVNIQHWQTSSGSQVYFVENHNLPMFDLAVNFPAGSAYDVPEKAGLASLTHHLLDSGANGMNEEAISNAFADIGAVLGGEHDSDRASLKLRTLVSEREKALSVFSQILHKPDFPQAAFEREKNRYLANIREAATQPESISEKAFMRALYPNHPYGLNGSGEENTLAAIKRDDLQAFYQTHYSAKSAVIALIGDLTVLEAQKIAEVISIGLPQTAAVPPLPAVNVNSVPKIEKITHPASQAHILLGQPGTKRGDADFFPLYVGNYILGGGGFVSRLTEEVREKRGLVYSVYSYFMPMRELGPYQIGLQTKKAQANDALKLVNETVAKFIAKGVTEKELKAAKDNLIGGFPMRIDSNGKILDYLSVIGFYNLPLTYLDEFNQKIAKVTAAQVKEAFARRIKPENFVTVIVGAE